jgi:hypothetical protein
LKLVVALLRASALAGCASDPRYAQGLEWVTWNEREKARLQALGFPQYEAGDGGLR